MTLDIDRGELSRALGRDVSSWSITPLDAAARFHSVTGGVYRVTADGESVVVKVVQHGTDADPGGLWVAGAEESHRNYWKREWLAYDSGLLGELPGELRAPRHLLTTEHRPAPSGAGVEQCWIWMEDVEGHPGSAWQPADYDTAAFDLGTTQGAYAAGHPLPDQAWLSRGWLEGWVDTVGRRVAVLDEDQSWVDDRLAPLLPLRAGVRRLWSARADLLAVVAAAPLTVVHCDLWPTNLIAADDGTTVAVDWSQVGIGGLAQDLDQLTLDPVWMSVLPDAAPTDLEAHVLPAYVAGLRTAGVDVDPDQLWTWYAAAASVHYALFAAWQPELVADPAAARAAERRFGRPVADVMVTRARVVERALELGELALGSAP